MACLLVDLGSTYTKVRVVQEGRLIGQAQGPTTAETNVIHGLKQALAQLPRGLRFDAKLACSSAAGGLRMVAIGLVPRLTAEAAKRAALGAGARVLDVFSYRLDDQALERIKALKPEIILLAGGTDGGNGEIIVANAHKLGELALEIPVVVAGNCQVADEVGKILETAGYDARVTENVLPQLGRLNVAPAREVIRQVFMERIVYSKGLGDILAFVDVLMPTPAAVLQGTQVLASLYGDLVVVDVGGATTDIHSAAWGKPTDPTVLWRGLPEPYLKRTVEGDLGMRHSAPSLWEQIRHQGCPPWFPPGQDGDDYVKLLAAKPDHLPQDEGELAMDSALAASALQIAFNRHVGYVEEVMTPTGPLRFQWGKDLTEVEWIVGTGGALVNATDPRWILQAVVGHDPPRLKPLAPRYLLDANYLLWAIGLYATYDQEGARKLAAQQMVSLS
ncbi:MAG: methylaspartate mutase accessory protein GlmL [Limnochordia bacterium]|jgi:uncharacterized protein (TIGR01319 family)